MIEGIGRVLDNEATKEEIYFTISSAVIMKFTRHAEYTPLHYRSLEERIWCICTKRGPERAQRAEIVPSTSKIALSTFGDLMRTLTFLA
jgi:hypothetical protein